jgi:PilZ domain-containing protein
LLCKIQHLAADDPMTLERLRRSDRVSISIPLEIFGSDLGGEQFVEQARTVIVSRYGATAVISRKLAPDQELSVRRPEKKIEALTRVVGQIGGQRDSYVYGLALADQNIDFWNIHFPPLAEAQRAVGRILLECRGCKKREVVYLDEIEAEVYEANLWLQRRCSRCGDSTIWKWVPKELRDDVPAPATAEPEAARAADVPPAAVVNRRKNLRIRSNMHACIRQPGFDDVVVKSEDVSRGGLCFRSGARYVVGSRVEVAMPYAASAANIFVPARIVHAQTLPEEGLVKYGISYLTR